MSLVVLRGDSGLATVNVTGWGAVVLTLNDSSFAHGVLAQLSADEADKLSLALRDAAQEARALAGPEVAR